MGRSKFEYSIGLCGRLRSVVSVLVVSGTLAGCGRSPGEPDSHDGFESSRRAERMEHRFDPAVGGEEPDASLFRVSHPAIAETSNAGVVYRHDRIRSVPWSIHVVEVDRGRPELEWVTTLSQNLVLGLGKLTEQIRTISPDRGQPVAAINGGFYYTEHDPFAGDPRGLQILDGELVSTPDSRGSVWFDPDGNPQSGRVRSELRTVWPDGTTIPCGLNENRRGNSAVLYTSRLGSSTRTRGGVELVLERDGDGDWLPLRVGQVLTARVAEVRSAGGTRLNDRILVLSLSSSLVNRLPPVETGATLKIQVATSPDLSGVKNALGAGPILLRGGKKQPARDHQPYSRHPRSAIGWNSKKIFLMTVDGRQPGLSDGMTLDELAEYLIRLGCEEGINLDGGASAEMWVDGEVVNSPCAGRERETANGLVLIRTK